MEKPDNDFLAIFFMLVQYFLECEQTMKTREKVYIVISLSSGTSDLYDCSFVEDYAFVPEGMVPSADARGQGGAPRFVGLLVYVDGLL